MRVPWSDISLNCKVQKHEVNKKKKKTRRRRSLQQKKRLKQVIRLLKKKKKTENHAWIKEQQNDMHELDRQYNDNSEN
jgi:hypothetical protein